MSRAKQSKFTERMDADIKLNISSCEPPNAAPFANHVRRPRRPYDKRNIKVFTVAETGKKIAVEVGMVGSIADAAPGHTAMLLKFAGQNPVIVCCDFWIALSWWTGQPMYEERSDV